MQELGFCPLPVPLYIYIKKEGSSPWHTYDFDTRITTNISEEAIRCRLKEIVVTKSKDGEGPLKIDFRAQAHRPIVLRTGASEITLFAKNVVLSILELGVEGVKQPITIAVKIIDIAGGKQTVASSVYDGNDKLVWLEQRPGNATARDWVNLLHQAMQIVAEASGVECQPLEEVLNLYDFNTAPGSRPATNSVAKRQIGSPATARPSPLSAQQPPDNRKRISHTLKELRYNIQDPKTQELLKSIMAIHAPGVEYTNDLSEEQLNLVLNNIITLSQNNPLQ